MSERDDLQEFHSPLAELIMAFIEEKRACGYRFKQERLLLLALDRRLRAIGHASADLPRDVVESWTARRPTEQPRNHEHRVRLVHQFARFALRRGVHAHVPDSRGLARRRALFTPYIFTREQIATLFAATDRLPRSSLAPLRHQVVPEVFRLLYCCGMRASETLHLRWSEVDLTSGVVTVLDGKFQKDRLIPLPRDLRDRLSRYVGLLGTRAPTAAFFPGPYGQPYRLSGLYRIFRRLLHECGISHGGRGRGPRVHDLRHSFAVHRLEDWYQGGADLGAKLPLLSTFMGHRKLESTQLYLRLTPHIFPALTAQLEARVGHVIPGGGQP
jgi:integrase